MKLALCLLTAFSLEAAGDEILLRNGGRLVGEVVSRTDRTMVVEIEGGQVSLPLAHVESVVAGPTPLGDYRDRAARLSAQDAAGWLELAQWASRERLDKPSREAFEQVLRADPANLAAHQALGDVLVNDRWLQGDEAYEARGYVRFEGRWMSPGERDAVMDARATEDLREQARHAARAQAREAQAQAKEAEARAREAEARARQAEADAAEREAAAARAEKRRPGGRLPYAQRGHLAYGLPAEGAIYSVCSIGSQHFLCEGFPRTWGWHRGSPRMRAFDDGPVPASDLRTRAR
jgi:hypothetical protein